MSETDEKKTSAGNKSIDYLGNCNIIHLINIFSSIFRHSLLKDDIKVTNSDFILQKIQIKRVEK